MPSPGIAGGGSCEHATRPPSPAACPAGPAAAAPRIVAAAGRVTRGAALRRPGTADRGSATVWLLGALSVVLLVWSAVLSLAAVGAARQRAATAADLAALAAASDRTADIRLACRRAASIATANGGRLATCSVDEEAVRVGVEAELPGPLRGLGPARAQARAGPWEGGPGAYGSAGAGQ